MANYRYRCTVDKDVNKKFYEKLQGTNRNQILIKDWFGNSTQK